MFLSLMLALCISTMPLPKKAQVIDIHKNIVTISINNNAYAFKGTEYSKNQNIIVIMQNNEIKEVF